MRVQEINEALSLGDISAPGMFSHVDNLYRMPVVFELDFGLSTIPIEPGIILIRGPRQYGKSTWLEQQLKETIKTYGAGSALYLNGDEISDYKSLMEMIEILIPLFSINSPVRRLFIDEITSVKNWQKALKILVDSGVLQETLVITTGSKASDLRRGSERLPGRKGKLERSQFYFTPISFAEFKRKCENNLKGDLLSAYILSGGSPIACAELSKSDRLPEYVIELTRDWVYGEIAASGRDRSMIVSIMHQLHRYGGTPIGQAKLARECGMANNTVAAGYLELLVDLMCTAYSYSWDKSRQISVRRRPCKYHMINLLAAISWHPSRIRSIRDYNDLSPADQGYLLEWLVAQELWRQAAIQGEEIPENMNYWKTSSHEIDFVHQRNIFIEVKRGKSSPLEYGWFSNEFRNTRLIVINSQRFETQNIVGITLEDFLLNRF